MKKSQLTVPNFAAYFLLAALALLFYLLYVLYQPFLTALIFAVFFATIFYPMHKFIYKIIGGHSRVASLISCLLTLLIIAVPLTFFVTVLLIEAVNASFDIAIKFQSGFFNQYFEWWKEGNILYDQFMAFYPTIQEKMGGNLLNFDVIGKIAQTAQEVGSNLLTVISTIFNNILMFFLGIVVFFFALYYFYKDGDDILDRIMFITPLPRKHDKAIFKKFKEVSLAMLFGIFFTAIIQGTLAGIGYAIVGIDNPIFWATATALFSLVPLFGTAIIWVPASIFLLISGNVIGGVGLLLWGTLIVGTVDNFIRPYLIEGRAPVHPLLTFLAVLGGIFAFGLKGIIYGPIILNLLLAFLHIYELEYAKVLKD
ncbi:AI-2E family transporter [Patescibacteria group bacterium]